ncbi:MAG: hypothetical protein ILO34_06040 [Kiritimatiellae bacterium]|nr:hypothetical protein [Kiritimatiellia bacterium]
MKYAKTILAALALCALPAAAELDNQPWISSPGEIFGCRFGEKIPGGKRIYLQNGFNFVYYTPQSKFRGKYTKYHRLVDEPTRQTIGVECQTPADGKDAAKKEVAEALADLAKLFPKANVKKDRLLVGYGEGGAGWDLAGCWEIVMSYELDPKHPDFDDPILPESEKGYVVFLRAVDEHLKTKKAEDVDEDTDARRRAKKRRERMRRKSEE